MTIKERILTFLKEQGISREDFYRTTELSASNFKGAALKSELGGDKIAKIMTTYKILSPEWLITGEGSMLKQNVSNDKKVDNTLVSSDKDTINKHTSQEETSYIYKMYQNEKEDWKEERRELKTQVNHLQSELRAMTAELAALKASHSQSQEKEPGHPPVMDKVTETFTSDSSGDYGEGFSPTKQPITSKRLSAGKM